MKTTRAAGAMAKGRDLEKKSKKTAGAEDFSQILAAVPLPLPKPAAVIPLAATRVDRPVANVHGSAKPTVRPAAPRQAPGERPTALAPAAVPTLEAPRPIAEPPPAPFVAALPEDPALRATIAPNAAAITIQTADGGDLSMYLRVRQGSAELRLEGASAPMIERRTDELRMVLASEGISLRHVEVTPPSEMQHTAAFSSEREQHAPPEPFERPDPDARPASKQAPSSSSSTPRAEAGHHVRA